MYFNEWNNDNGLYWHMIEFLSFILSGLIFVGRFPERLCPGLFDLFGQSHHGFHLMIFLMGYSQANAVFKDMIAMKSNDIQLNFVKDILFTLMILILQLILICFWFRISRPTIEQRYKIHLKK